MAISLAVSTQYTNVTDTQPARHRTTTRAALCSLVIALVAWQKYCSGCETVARCNRDSISGVKSQQTYSVDFVLDRQLFKQRKVFNPLIATLKAQSNGPSYSNTVIGTLAVDGWALTFGTARRGLGGAAARPGPSSLYQM